MLSVYDLYDLSAVYKLIRYFPQYELNIIILEKVLEVLRCKDNTISHNQFRTVLSEIPFLDRERFEFVYTNNVYTYFPSLLKDELAYKVLIEATEKLKESIVSNNTQFTIELADCLHDLPPDIVENQMKIPKQYWKREFAAIRRKWDKTFVK
ncbi:MAG: hypothetical protein IJ391_06665 [Clostridia bacterium]|nr:hypothetical protein [Clostridia bacterium]